MRVWTIYALVLDGAAFYVGGSQNMSLRIKDHRKRFGGLFEVKTLEKCGPEWRDREHYWIERHRTLGALLANKTKGRNGGEGLSDETRAKLSAAKKGIPKPPGHGGKISAMTKGKPHNWSPEGLERAKVVQFRPGHVGAGQGYRDPANRKSPDAARRSRLTWWTNMDMAERSKMMESLANARALVTPAGRAKNREASSRAHKGVPKSPEHKAKIAAARRGSKWSAERRAQYAAKRAAQEAPLD